MKNYLIPNVVMSFWITGSIILIFGGSILSYSRFTIGKQGTLIIGIEKDHKLITTGIYRYVRHPIYSGIIFFFLGFALSFSGIISSVLILAFFVVWFQKRLIFEEKLLLETFGEEYREYMKRTKRLIPFIY